MAPEQGKRLPSFLIAIWRFCGSVVPLVCPSILPLGPISVAMNGRHLGPQQRQDTRGTWAITYLPWLSCWCLSVFRGHQGCRHTRSSPSSLPESIPAAHAGCRPCCLHVYAKFLARRCNKFYLPFVILRRQFPPHILGIVVVNSFSHEFHKAGVNRSCRLTDRTGRHKIDLPECSIRGRSQSNILRDIEFLTPPTEVHMPRPCLKSLKRLGVRLAAVRMPTSCIFPCGPASIEHPRNQLGCHDAQNCECACDNRNTPPRCRGDGGFCKDMHGKKYRRNAPSPRKTGLCSGVRSTRLGFPGALVSPRPSRVQVERPAGRTSMSSRGLAWQLGSGTEPTRSSSRIRSGSMIVLGVWLFALVGAWVAIGLSRVQSRSFSRSALISLPVRGPSLGLSLACASRRAGFALPGRVCPVQVERPTGRTTWTRQTRSGRLWCATGSQRAAAGHPRVARVQGRGALAAGGHPRVVGPEALPAGGNCPGQPP